MRKEVIDRLINQGVFHPKLIIKIDNIFNEVIEISGVTATQLNNKSRYNEFYFPRCVFIFKCMDLYYNVFNSRYYVSKFHALIGEFISRNRATVYHIINKREIEPLKFEDYYKLFNKVDTSAPVLNIDHKNINHKCDNNCYFNKYKDKIHSENCRNYKGSLTHKNNILTQKNNTLELNNKELLNSNKKLKANLKKLVNLVKKCNTEGEYPTNNQTLIAIDLLNYI